MSRERLLARLAGEGLVAQAWSNGPGDRYAAHSHGYDKVIVVAEGSIVFELPGSGERVELATGDRLELPAGTTHRADVGPAGVSCLEAHRPAGTLSTGPRRVAAGDW
jgi:quercetin dioxygenase-like cupin family protein